MAIDLSKLSKNIDKDKYFENVNTKYGNGYTESDNVIAALNKKNEAENAVTNYGDFAYMNESEYKNAMDAIKNRKKFSYDLNGDALYQQYKDNHMTQGKQAMMDTMGQAAAMTGGYGNSYAATVGNQTYQGYLQNLNNVVPELYQMALDRYNMEGDQLLTNFNLIKTDRDDAYGKWNDAYDKLIGERDYHGTNYTNLRNSEFGEWDANRTYDTNQAWGQYDADYKANQDSIANKLAVENYNLNERSVDAAEEANRLAALQKQYAINDLADVSGGIIDYITSITKRSNVEKTPQQKNQDIATYLEQLVESGVISPAVSIALSKTYWVDETAKPPLNTKLPKNSGNGGR